MKSLVTYVCTIYISAYMDGFSNPVTTYVNLLRYLILTILRPLAKIAKISVSLRLKVNYCNRVMKCIYSIDV